ncbi:M23 family peptidase, partial [Kocuria rosea]
MTTTRRLAVAGASATVLVGGLFLGVPAAVAAPGDAPPVDAPPGAAASTEVAGAVAELPTAVPADVPVAEVLVAEAAPPAPAEVPVAEP